MHVLMLGCADAPADAWSALDTSPPALLRKLLQDSQRSLLPDEPQTLCPRSERLQAQALGLPELDGSIPWAAWHARQSALEGASDQPWAWVTPCHWEAQTGQVQMHDPAQLALSAADAETLRQAMAPWFAQDGIALLPDPECPTRWLARGAPLAGLRCASLQRVRGAVVDGWLQQFPLPAPLRRLHSEMQMLLYTHPLNDARAAARQPVVNSYWFSGAGALPALAAQPPDDTLLLSLPALHGAADAAAQSAWIQAWLDVWEQAAARLLPVWQHGQPSCLSLCGPRSVMQLRPSAVRPWWQRWLNGGARTAQPPLGAALRALDGDLTAEPDVGQQPGHSLRGHPRRPA